MNKEYLEDYPIHDPDDESNGMNLIKKNYIYNKNNYDMEDILKFKKLNFKSFMKKYTKDDKKNNRKYRIIKESSDYPKGSSWSTKPSGSNLSRKSSYQQPGSGKTTFGSHYSLNSAFKKDRSLLPDINDLRNSLTSKEKEKLEYICDILNVSENDILYLAVKNGWDKETMFSVYLASIIKKEELKKNKNTVYYKCLDL